MFYTVNFSVSQLGFTFAGSFGTKWFHDTALALFHVGVTDPTNKTALDNLANKIATDYINWLLESFDESFAQIIAPTADALTDMIEWTYRPDQCSTRRYSSPYNGEPEELMHNDPANAACIDSTGVTVSQEPCIFFYGPPFSCVSGKPTMTRYKVCFIDGILTQKYVSTDTMT